MFVVVFRFRVEIGISGDSNVSWVPLSTQNSGSFLFFMNVRVRNVYISPKKRVSYKCTFYMNEKMSANPHNLFCVHSVYDMNIVSNVVT